MTFLRIVDDKGQSAFSDAVLFLSILLVASAVTLGLFNYQTQMSDLHSFLELQSYTERVAITVLSSTVPNASYLDVNGNEVFRRDITVQDMMVEELLLLETGVPMGNFDGEGRYNSRIELVPSSILDENRFFWVLSGEYLGEKVMIGGTTVQTGGERAAYGIEIPLPGEPSEVKIALFLWRL